MDANGVTGELVYTKRGDYDEVAGKIAVNQIERFKNSPIGIVMNKRDAVPKESQLVSSDGDLVVTSALKEADLKKSEGIWSEGCNLGLEGCLG